MIGIEERFRVYRRSIGNEEVALKRGVVKKRW